MFAFLLTLWNSEALKYFPETSCTQEQYTGHIGLRFLDSMYDRDWLVDHLRNETQNAVTFLMSIGNA